MFVNRFFEERAERLLDLGRCVEELFETAGLDYRVAGGLAVYLYVEEVDPDAGRLTRDIDIVVRREDLPAIAGATEAFGLQYRVEEGRSMLVQTGAPTRRAVHLLIAGEHAVPPLGPCRTVRQLHLIPLADLVRMKLTSFRARDAAHLVDLDDAGLITPEIEASLPETLRQRLAEARARG